MHHHGNIDLSNAFAYSENGWVREKNRLQFIFLLAIKCGSSSWYEKCVQWFISAVTHKMVKCCWIVCIGACIGFAISSVSFRIVCFFSVLNIFRVEINECVYLHRNEWCSVIVAFVVTVFVCSLFSLMKRTWKKSHSYAFILRKYLAQTRKITHSTFQSHHKRDRGMRARAREEDVKGEKSQNRLQRKRK